MDPVEPGGDGFCRPDRARRVVFLCADFWRGGAVDFAGVAIGVACARHEGNGWGSGEAAGGSAEPAAAAVDDCSGCGMFVGDSVADGGFCLYECECGAACGSGDWCGGE